MHKRRSSTYKTESGGSTLGDGYSVYKEKEGYHSGKTVKETEDESAATEVAPSASDIPLPYDTTIQRPSTRKNASQ